MDNLIFPFKITLNTFLCNCTFYFFPFCFEIIEMTRPRHIGPYKKYLRNPDASIPKTTAWLRRKVNTHYNKQQVCNYDSLFDSILGSPGCVWLLVWGGSCAVGHPKDILGQIMLFSTAVLEWKLVAIFCLFEVQVWSPNKVKIIN